MTAHLPASLENARGSHSHGSRSGWWQWRDLHHRVWVSPLRTPQKALITHSTQKAVSASYLPPQESTMTFCSSHLVLETQGHDLKGQSHQRTPERSRMHPYLFSFCSQGWRDDPHCKGRSSLSPSDSRVYGFVNCEMPAEPGIEMEAS